MSIEKRINDLEDSMGDGNECPKCHGKYIAAILEGEAMPGPCPMCGNGPMFIVETADENGRELVQRLARGEQPQREVMNEDT